MYILLYESFKGNLKFETESDDEYVKIKAFLNGNEIGHINIEFIISGFWIFEGEITEEEYDEHFPNDRFAKIESFKVYDKYKGKGYSKEIFKKGIDYIQKSSDEEIIYLNASPMGYGLDIDQLVNLYKSFGFETIISYPENKEMILRLV
jgi:GNAT superfamily N-acetyltransferase